MVISRKQKIYHMNKLVSILLISLNCFSFCNAQINSSEALDDALYTLKEYIRDWSCEPILEGSFKESLEISLNESRLILKKNWTRDYVEFFGFPEYTKYVIELKMIKSISIQENDNSKLCAGIKIKTRPEGIKMIDKYKNSNTEAPQIGEDEFREKIGWVDDSIRLKKNESFDSRCSRVIQVLKDIAIFHGNTLLQ